MVGICVYSFYNTKTGETYAGSTSDGKRRVKDHVRDLENGKHSNKRFQRSFNRNPDFELNIVPMDSREEAFDLEQAIIDEFWGNPLFLNISRDARYCCVAHTDESKDKLRQAQLGRKKTPEELAKQSQVQKQRFENMSVEERRYHMAPAIASIIGVMKTDEQRTAISARKTGVSLSQEHKDAIASSLKGRVFSDEERVKLSQNHAKNTSVVINGVEYPSLAEAARALDLTPATVRGRILSTNPQYSEYEYAQQ